MLRTIILMIGCPGSGKTTFAKAIIKHAEFTNHSVIHISRDVIRFSKLKETDNYFGKETEVFAEFQENIQKAIKDRIEVIIVDATHLNTNSRKKLFNGIDLEEYHIEAIVCNVDLNTCLTRNEKRKGLAHVPDEAIISMHKSLQFPTNAELDNYTPDSDNKVYVLGEKDIDLYIERFTPVS